MELNSQQQAFLQRNHSAAMVTLRPDGTPHAVRVGVALIDGTIWSSGVPSRRRTRFLRHDPRCTMFVFEPGYSFLTLEGRAAILDGLDAPDLNMRLFQTMQADMPSGPAPGHLFWQGKQLTLDAFRQAMVDEKRLIYQLGIERAYGLITG